MCTQTKSNIQRTNSHKFSVILNLNYELNFLDTFSGSERLVSWGLIKVKANQRFHVCKFAVQWP